MSKDKNLTTIEDQVADTPQEDVVLEDSTVTAENIDEVSTEEVVVAKDANDFRVGDTVKVFYKIIEGNKSRIQPYQGIVIGKKGMGTSKTFTVRRIGVDNIGVERIFPVFSPNIDKIEILKRGKVRRAKLYYLRSKKGREAMRVKELGK